MNNGYRITIATPHSRYDRLERRLRDHQHLAVQRLCGRDELTVDTLRAFGPRYVFFPHWSWRIPLEILNEFECVIFHMTDLPFGRGGSPLQNLVQRGMETTRLSALRCVEELDAGPVYLKRPLSTLGSAEEVFLRAADLMEEMIDTIVTGQIRPEPQTGKPTMFTRRRPEQGDLARARTINDAHDLIRMLDAEGYPHAFVDAGPLRLTFTRSSLRGDHVLADVRIEIRDQEDER